MVLTVAPATVALMATQLLARARSDAGFRALSTPQPRRTAGEAAHGLLRGRSAGVAGCFDDDAPLRHQRGVTRLDRRR